MVQKSSSNMNSLKYRPTIGGFQGTTTDPMIRYSNGMYFTTKDSDNDICDRIYKNRPYVHI